MHLTATCKSSTFNHSSSDESFLIKTVHSIEYQRVYSHLASSKKAQLKPYVTLPTFPFSKTELFTTTTKSQVDSVCENAQFVFPLSIANSQYFLENFFQSVLKVLSSRKSESESESESTPIQKSRRQEEESENDPVRDMSFLLGGDGRTLNHFATDAFLRVAAGNRAKAVYVAAPGI